VGERESVSGLILTQNAKQLLRRRNGLPARLRARDGGAVAVPGAIT
jgi:hypothetical protein